MNPLLAALVAAGVIDRAEAERINRLLNDDLRRTWAEQQIAAATARALRAQQQRLATAAGEGGAPALVQESLWRSEDRQLAQAVLPSLRSVAGDAAIVASVRSGLDAWQATNTGVIDWVNQYYTGAAGDALGSIPSLNRVTREEVGRLVNLWQTGDLPGGPQLGLPDLIASMESSFGAERGARIAVTETTRVFAESTRAAAIANPAVTMLRWGTARDEIVCPICGPFDGQTITKYQRAFPGGYFPPAHPNCRCDVTEETAFTMNVPLGIGGAGTWTYGSS